MKIFCWMQNSGNILIQKCLNVLTFPNCTVLFCSESVQPQSLSLLQDNPARKGLREFPYFTIWERQRNSLWGCVLVRLILSLCVCFNYKLSPKARSWNGLGHGSFPGWWDTQIEASLPELPWCLMGIGVRIRAVQETEFLLTPRFWNLLSFQIGIKTKKIETYCETKVFWEKMIRFDKIKMSPSNFKRHFLLFII